MKYIVDTHVLIWYVEGKKQLRREIISIIENYQNEIFISNATLWEIAIKKSIGKLNFSISFSALENFLFENNFDLLEYDYTDLSVLINLPFYHQDPFDRMIIGQAIAKDISVISDDEKFKKYPIKLII